MKALFDARVAQQTDKDPSNPTVEKKLAKGMQWQDRPLLDVQRLSDSNVVLKLKIEPAGSFPFHAGQFVYVRSTFDGVEDKAAYSIASPPHQTNRIELCVKKVEGGKFSHWLYERNAGETLSVSRALGSFRFATPSNRTVVFFATGTGIAPLRSILLDQFEKKDTRDFWLFYGVGREVNLVYDKEFRTLAQTLPNFHYVPVVSRAALSWNGERGWIQEPFLKQFQNRTDYDAYVCGIKRMVDDMVNLLRSKGLPESSVYFEKYV